MAKNKNYTVRYKRKRLSKTDYSKRKGYLSSGKPRLVVRGSLNNILLQVVEFHPTGDKVVSTAHSSGLKKLGWKHHTGNIPSAYLTGYMLGKKAKVKEVVVDLGLSVATKGSRLFAAIKGVVDGGLNVPCSEGVFPKEDIIKGNVIEKNYEKIKKQYKTPPIGMVKDFETVRDKIK